MGSLVPCHGALLWDLERYYLSWGEPSTSQRIRTLIELDHLVLHQLRVSITEGRSQAISSRSGFCTPPPWPWCSVSVRRLALPEQAPIAQDWDFWIFVSSFYLIFRYWNSTSSQNPYPWRHELVMFNAMPGDGLVTPGAKHQQPCVQHVYKTDTSKINSLGIDCLSNRVLPNQF